MANLFEWVQQDSNLQPIGYASHYSFRCLNRVCGLDFPLTLPQAAWGSYHQVSTPSRRGLGSGLPFDRLPRIWQVNINLLPD